MPEYEVEQTEHEYFTHPAKKSEEDLRVVEPSSLGLNTEERDGETEPEVFTNPPKLDMDDVLRRAYGNDLDEGVISGNPQRYEKVETQEEELGEDPLEDTDE